jgi:hypothetical protein
MRISDMAMSAVASVSTPGVFVTSTPRSRQAATSTLSYPTATFATTRSPGPAASQHLSVHPVDEHRDQSVDPGQGGQELVPGHRGVDVAEDDVVAGLAKARHGIPHDLSSDENAPHGHMIFRTSGRGR